jgi:FecR protein
LQFNWNGRWKVKDRLRILTVLCFATALFLAMPLSAQDQDQTGDPPNRVARLTYMSGAVSFEPAGENDWSAASLNYPLSSADRLWTDKDARAELETGNLAIRMSEQTDLTATSLTDQLAQFGLAQGTIRISAYDLRSGHEVEVDTPNAAVTIVQPGDYRIETYPDQSRTLITVNRGEVQVTGNDLNQTVGSGQALELSGGNPPQVNQVGLPPSDSFDQWCNDRDRK